jgi:hypothetical protein
MIGSIDKKETLRQNKAIKRKSAETEADFNKRNKLGEETSKLLEQQHERWLGDKLLAEEKGLADDKVSDSTE